jgi:hypothetical protein
VRRTHASGRHPNACRCACRCACPVGRSGRHVRALLAASSHRGIGHTGAELVEDRLDRAVAHTSLLSRISAGRSGHGWRSSDVRRNAPPDADSTHGVDADSLAGASVRRTGADCFPDDDLAMDGLMRGARVLGSRLHSADRDRGGAWRRLWGSVVPRRNPAIRAGDPFVGTSPERMPPRMPLRLPPCAHQGPRADSLAAREAGC